MTARIPIARGRAKRFSSTGIYPACSAQNVVVRQLSSCRRSTQDRFLSVMWPSQLCGLEQAGTRIFAAGIGESWASCRLNAT